LADAAAEVVRRIGENEGLNSVCLSGGVFQNALLTELILPVLRRLGMRVYINRQVPPNDGGVSLGQAAVAGFRRREIG
jgi:hydrogenase maturation protein HypF